MGGYQLKPVSALSLEEYKWSLPEKLLLFFGYDLQALKLKKLIAEKKGTSRATKNEVAFLFEDYKRRLASSINCGDNEIEFVLVGETNAHRALAKKIKRFAKKINVFKCSVKDDYGRDILNVGARELKATNIEIKIVFF